MDSYWPCYGIWPGLEALGDSLGRTWVLLWKYGFMAVLMGDRAFFGMFGLFGQELIPSEDFKLLGPNLNALEEFRLLARSCLLDVNPSRMNLRTHNLI